MNNVIELRDITVEFDGERVLDVLMIAKSLERIGDHATNLAEWVEYAQTGARSKNGHWVSPEAQATGWI